MADERPGAALSGNAKKAVAKKTSAKKTPAKKTPAKKTPAKKTPAGTAGGTAPAPPRRAAWTRAPATKAAAKSDAPTSTTGATGTPVTTARDRVIRTGSASATPPGAPQMGHRSAPVRLASAAAGTTLQVAGLPARAARSVLDRRGGLPAYLGAGALAVGGVIEWPAAVGAGAGYAALRRWGGRLPQPLRSLTGSSRDR